MVDMHKYKDGDISRLGLGTMRLPCKTLIKREANPLIDYEKAQILVDMAFENGVNYFDTAYMYHAGKSEKFIGTALKKYPRTSYMVADKLPIWFCRKKEDMEKIFSKQLERTGLTYFDNYLLHALDKKNFDKCEEYGAYDFLLKKQSEGKIKNIGFSFHGTINDLREIVASHHWDFAQIQMNYLDWKNQDAKTQYEILTDANIPVIVMEPVRGGKLADPCKEANEMFLNADVEKSIASWAISFVASFPNVMTILSGMNSQEQMMDNLNTLTDFTPFDEKKFNICSIAASMIEKNDLIPCTGCDYCADCPKKVKISSLFSAYNSFKNGDLTKEQAVEKYNLIDVKEDECIKCGKCMGHCPQSIKIPDMLETKVHNFFN